MRAERLAEVGPSWAALAVAAVLVSPVLLERSTAGPSLTRARAALAQATAVRWVGRAAARFHAVATGHAARSWVPPGFVVAMAVVWVRQPADEVRPALRQGPARVERLSQGVPAWAALIVVAVLASPEPMEQLAVRRPLARPHAAVARAVRRVVRAVGRFHAYPPCHAAPETE